MNNNLKKVYGDLVIDFFEACNKEKIEEKVQVEHPSIFITGVGENYGKVQPKILYIGIDTNSWEDLAKDINEYKLVKDNEEKKEKFLERVINFASERLNEQAPFKEWYIKHSSQYWNFIDKTQETLFKEFNKENLSKDFLRTSFAWANTNAIQIKTKDKNVRKYIREISKPFNNLNVVLEGLETKPDLVVILNWGIEAKKYLGIDIVEQEKHDDKHLQYYVVIKDYISIPIIWTAHPRYLSTHGGNDYYVKEIIKIVKDKKIFKNI